MYIDFTNGTMTIEAWCTDCRRIVEAKMVPDLGFTELICPESRAHEVVPPRKCSCGELIDPEERFCNCCQNDIISAAVRFKNGLPDDIPLGDAVQWAIDNDLL